VAKYVSSPTECSEQKVRTVITSELSSNHNVST